MYEFVAFLVNSRAPPDHVNDVRVGVLTKQTRAISGVPNVCHYAFVPRGSLLDKSEKPRVSFVHLFVSFGSKDAVDVKQLVGGLARVSFRKCPGTDDNTRSKRTQLVVWALKQCGGGPTVTMQLKVLRDGARLLMSGT